MYRKNNTKDKKEFMMNILKQILKRALRQRGFEIVSDDCRKHPGTEVKLPRRGSKHAAAYDLFSPIDIIIQPGMKVLIFTDIKAYCKKKELVIINVRSSMGRHPVMLANTTGWIDSDYYGNVVNDGNIGVNLYNIGKEPYVIKKGDRIAQAMFAPFLVSNNCNTEDERIDGFGSTGI